ncbi:hypothetical protein D3C84_455370 [compost metagenome]
MLVGRQPAGGLLLHRAQGVVLLHRQGFAGEHRLADEQVAGFDQADIGGNHVASGEPHYVAGHQFAHGNLAQLGTHAALVTAQHAGGGAHHGLERFGGPGRTVLLPEAHQPAGQDHGQDDDHAGEVGVLARLRGQPEVGEEADRGQRHQHIDEGIVEGLQQLQEGMRRPVVGHLVGAVLVQARLGFGLVEAVLAAADIGEGGFQAVLRLAGGAHG